MKNAKMRLGFETVIAAISTPARRADPIVENKIYPDPFFGTVGWKAFCESASPFSLIRADD